jgi:hypothetical protein
MTQKGQSPGLSNRSGTRAMHRVAQSVGCVKHCPKRPQRRLASARRFPGAMRDRGLGAETKASAYARTSRTRPQRDLTSTRSLGCARHGLMGTDRRCSGKNGLPGLTRGPNCGIVAAPFAHDLLEEPRGFGICASRGETESEPPRQAAGHAVDQGLLWHVRYWRFFSVQSSV